MITRNAAFTLFSALLIVLAIAAPVDARHLKVYSPYELEGGELELAYWLDAFLNTPLAESGPFPRQHLLRHTFEVAYGITDRWYAAAYVDFEQPTRQGASQFTLAQYRFETLYRFIDRRDYWPAVALYAEYTIPRRQYERRDEIEFKLLMESRVREFMVRLNPVIERTFNDASNVNFGYETGVYWFARRTVRLGVEGFGNFGPIGSFPTTNFQRHSWGPAIKLIFGRVAWDLGLQLGWTHGSDYAVVKSIIDVEF